MGCNDIDENLVALLVDYFYNNSIGIGEEIKSLLDEEFGHKIKRCKKCKEFYYGEECLECYSNMEDK
jgi:hypothetical protein